jgi:hypothetical protein
MHTSPLGYTVSVEVSYGLVATWREVGMGWDGIVSAPRGRFLGEGFSVPLGCQISPKNFILGGPRG